MWWNRSKADADAEAEAIVQKFIREHEIPADVARDCPELTAEAHRLIGELVAQLRTGAIDPAKADLALRAQLVSWAVSRAAANDRANAKGDIVLI